MNHPTRRRILESGLTLGLGAVAGCTGAPGGSTQPPTESPEETPTRPPPGTSATPTPSSPVVTDATLHTLGGTCGDTAAAEITQTADGIRVDGTIVAPTPCHEAVLTSVSDEGRVARFAIDVEEPLGTPVCAQCIAEISFELTATFHGRFDAAVVALDGYDQTTVRKELS